MSEIITQENYNASANSAIGEEDLRARDIDKENPTRFTDRDFQPRGTRKQLPSFREDQHRPKFNSGLSPVSPRGFG